MTSGEKTEELRKSIGLFQAVMYGVGLILGAGIYVLIGDAAGIAGNAMWISFIIAATIALFTGFSYAELSSIFPKSAAEYVYVKNAFKNDLLAFVTGFLIIFIAIVSAAAVAIGFAGYLSYFIPQINPVISAIILIAALSLINFIGIRESAWMNALFTLVEIAGLAIIIAIGIFFASSPEKINYYDTPAVVIDGGASNSLIAFAGSILGAAGLIFFAYYGFENLANIAEETKNARKVIPKALMISIAVTTVLYVLVALSAISVVGWEKLSASNAPIATVAEKAFGSSGVVLLSAIALFATSNTVLMMLVSSSRIIYGMAKGNALPNYLSGIHASTKTPWLAIIITMGSSIVIIASSMGSLATVAKVGVFGIFIVYALVNLSVILLRYREPDRERMFRSPLTIGKFPVIAGMGLITTLAMLTQFDINTVIMGILTVIASVVSFAILDRWKRSYNMKNIRM